MRRQGCSQNAENQNPDRQGGAESYIHGRSGHTGVRPRGPIAIHAVRTGDVVGMHEIHFGGPGETITIAHTAHSRATFAAGALRAAEWIVNQAPGMFTMSDVTNQSTRR